MTPNLTICLSSSKTKAKTKNLATYGWIVNGQGAIMHIYKINILAPQRSRMSHNNNTHITIDQHIIQSSVY